MKKVPGWTSFDDNVQERVRSALTFSKAVTYIHAYEIEYTLNTVIDRRRRCHILWANYETISRKTASLSS